MFNYYSSIWSDPANYFWQAGSPIGGSCVSSSASSTAARPLALRGAHRIAE